MGVANDVSSFLGTVVRLGRGITPVITAAQRPDPAQLLDLFEFEGCPYCRKVREILCELDLDYKVHPVAHGSPGRAALRKLGGKVQVPFLVDPNTGVQMYESDDINAYLNATYGAGRRAGWRLPVPSLVDDLVSGLATAARLGAGTRCRVGERRHQIEPLTLYNMEGSPYCRKVREALSTLDLEHIVRNVPKGSPKRAALKERGGKIQVPFLIDPNTGTELYESDDIVAYLEQRYGPKPGTATESTGRKRHTSHGGRPASHP
jgi:glutathione S-transferase